jgi:MinD superfamily P-loop ATPase
MQIAMLSGKGGAGKTLLAVNLANLIDDVYFLDCDVEEPNGVFYFGDQFEKEAIYQKIPKINDDQCRHCNACVDFCRYNALIDFLGKVKVLPSLCHACGGCQMVCPHQAITEVDDLVGHINYVNIDQKHIFGGELKIGKESGVLLIENLLDKVPNDVNSIIDCPPGNGCSVMESIKDSDFCVLVAEPTIFGLENLKMVAELTKVYHKKTGVVINKATDDVSMIERFAEEENLPILGIIPFDKQLAYDNSQLGMVSNGQYRHYFEDILESIWERM